MKPKVFLLFLIIISFLLSSCGAGQLLGPTVTPTPTSTNTPSPTPTNTPTPAPTSTPTLTPTPVPVCNSDASVQGEVNEDMLEYLDILNVSSILVDSKLTVIFTLREIPDEITINNDNLQKGYPEIAWGIAIDTDNNPDTGQENFLTRSGYGYEYIFQTFNFKIGAEKTGSIQNLFRSSKTYVWKMKEDHGMSSGATGTFTVNQEEKTITLEAKVKGITVDSYLHFFTFYNNVDEILQDEICER